MEAGKGLPLDSLFMEDNMVKVNVGISRLQIPWYRKQRESGGHDGSLYKLLCKGHEELETEPPSVYMPPVTQGSTS